MSADIPTLPWAMVEATIGGRIEEVRTSLERAQQGDVPMLQGELRALRWVLGMPSRVKNDLAARMDAETIAQAEVPQY